MMFLLRRKYSLPAYTGPCINSHCDSLKLKRLQAAKVYRKEIERMYAEIESVSKENSLKL